MTTIDIKALKQRIIDGYRVGYEEALGLLSNLPAEDLHALAHELRTHYQGKKIDTCSIMNARSGRCSEDCKWCAQSKFHKTDVEVYPLVGAAEALKEAQHNASKGVGRFSLVTSGRTLTNIETDRVCKIYDQIGKNVNIHLCASLGLLDREQLKQLHESGVEHYHCNLETAPSHFSTLCSTHTMEEKIQTINWAREVGLKICSGGIIGMGESQEQRVEFAIKLQEIGAVSIPVNVLNPIPGTPLENVKPLSDTEVMSTVAILRVVNPEANIRLAGGRNMIKHLEQRLLMCGVSASIVGDLLTTTGSDINSDKEMFHRCGFEA